MAEHILGAPDGAQQKVKTHAIIQKKQQICSDPAVSLQSLDRHRDELIHNTPITHHLPLQTSQHYLARYGSLQDRNNKLLSTPFTHTKDMYMNEEVNYVGFWARTLAAVIDSIWLYGIIYTILYFILGSDLFSLSSEYTITQFSFEYLVPVVVVMAFWIIKSSTPGKMIFGMKIVDAETYGKVTTQRLFLRYISYFIAMLPLFLGIIWVGFDKKKQGWHDKIAKTVVIKK
ncbi:MAG: RDD family protein [Halopseudomonas sp.]